MVLIEPGKVFVGVSGKPEYVHLPFANRHGLITGATGTGKTVSLQILAEGFSAAGVPVFCADVKGDVAGLSMPGEPKDFLQKRAETIGFTGEYRFESFPVVFWDLFGKQGHPIRATVSEMGPLLLARLLDLNDTQEGVLTIAFRIADEEGLLLLDLKDLQATARLCRRPRRRIDHPLRQRLQGERRRRPAFAADARAAGRGILLRRTGAQDRRPDADRVRRPRHRQHPRRRHADAVAAALRDLPPLAALGAVRRAARDRRPATSRSSSSSSTRRISSSTTRRRRSSRRSSWSSVWSGRRASASTSSRRTRSTFPTSCSPRSATACSMRSAPSRRATPRR